MPLVRLLLQFLVQPEAPCKMMVFVAGGADVAEASISRSTSLVVKVYKPSTASALDSLCAACEHLTRVPNSSVCRL